MSPIETVEFNLAEIVMAAARLDFHTAEVVQTIPEGERLPIVEKWMTARHQLTQAIEAVEAFVAAAPSNSQDPSPIPGQKGT